MTDILNKEQQILNFEHGFINNIDEKLDNLLKKYKVSDEVLIEYVKLKENVLLRYIDNLFQMDNKQKDRNEMSVQKNSDRNNLNTQNALDRANRITIANNECSCRTNISTLPKEIFHFWFFPF